MWAPPLGAGVGAFLWGRRALLWVEGLPSERAPGAVFRVAYRLSGDYGGRLALPCGGGLDRLRALLAPLSALPGALWLLEFIACPSSSEPSGG